MNGIVKHKLLWVCIIIIVILSLSFYILLLNYPYIGSTIPDTGIEIMSSDCNNGIVSLNIVSITVNDPHIQNNNKTWAPSSDIKITRKCIDGGCDIEDYGHGDLDTNFNTDMEPGDYLEILASCGLGHSCEYTISCGGRTRVAQIQC